MNANLNISDLLSQTLAAVIGGIILFLLGLAYSLIQRRSKQYTNWIAENWRIIVAGVLTAYVTSYVYHVTHSIYLALVPLVFQSTMFLYVVQLLEPKRPSEKLKKELDKLDELNKKLEDLKQKKQKDDLERLIDERIEKKLKALDREIIFQQILHWESEGVNENVISASIRFLEISKDDSSGLIFVLDKVEDAIKRHKENGHKVSTFNSTELLDALQGIPEKYNLSRKRISMLLENNS